MIRIAFAIQSERIYRPSQPIRDAAYLRWVRTLPCACCNRRASEAAHMGPHGLGQKSSDLSAIPLCRVHHRTGKDSYHKLGPVKFEQAHPHLKVAELIVRLNGIYELISERRTA